MSSNVWPGATDEGPADGSLEMEFSIALARIIESSEENPAQLRNAIYELARIMLQREAWQRSPAMESSEIHRRTLALESAIERVETIASQVEKSRATRTLDRRGESAAARPNGFPAGPRDPILSIGLDTIGPTAAADSPVPPTLAKRSQPMWTRVRAWLQSPTTRSSRDLRTLSLRRSRTSNRCRPSGV